MKYLLLPESNSLSHLSKVLALRRELLARRQEAVLGVTAAQSALLTDPSIERRVLPSLAEGRPSGYPSPGWFRDVGRIRAVIEAEASLLRQERPDRVVGVFRMTLPAAAQLAGIPCDMLSCGCLLPDCPEGMGFAPDEAGAEHEREQMGMFFRYVGARLSQALRSLGLAPVDDAREQLLGDRTWLWDFPEFMPAAVADGRCHVGPVGWDCWPQGWEEMPDIPEDAGPLAIVAFGTTVGSLAVARRLVGLLVDQGYYVVLAAGRQPELIQETVWRERVCVCSFAPLYRLLPRAKLLLSHGGQMTLFAAMAHGVPTVVMPFQPEQAHNGVCLERLGCGGRLLPAVHFHGDSRSYLDALAARSDAALSATVAAVAALGNADGSMALARELLAHYGGAAQLAQQLCGLVV